MDATNVVIDLNLLSSREACCSFTMWFMPIVLRTATFVPIGTYPQQSFILVCMSHVGSIQSSV